MAETKQAQSYEIVVAGELTDSFGGALGDVALERRKGTTAVRVGVLDQSQLHGLIGRLRDLGIELISVNACA